MKTTNTTATQAMQNPKDAIPDLYKLYDVLRNFIKEHQGEKGYIDTQNLNGKADSIYGIENLDVVTEVSVKAVKVDECDDILVLTDSTESKCIWSEDCFQDPFNWCSLKSSDIYFVPTLISICESISQYI